MSPKKEKLILLAIGIVILAAIAGTGYWIWAKFAPPKEENKISIEKLAEEKPEEKSAAEPAKEPISEEKPAEEKKINSVEVSVKVLNGGAAAGSAAKIRDLLKTKGYAKIEAANANLSSYTAVTIYYKSEFKSEAEKIKEALTGQYKVIETKEGTNAKEPSGDIVVVLGK